MRGSAHGYEAETWKAGTWAIMKMMKIIEEMRAEHVAGDSRDGYPNPEIPIVLEHGRYRPRSGAFHNAWTEGLIKKRYMYYIRLRCKEDTNSK